MIVGGIINNELFSYFENNTYEIPETIETTMKYNWMVQAAITGLILTSNFAHASVMWYREISSEVMRAQTYKREKTSCCV